MTLCFPSYWSRVDCLAALERLGITEFEWDREHSEWAHITMPARPAPREETSAQAEAFRIVKECAERLMALELPWQCTEDRWQALRHLGRLEGYLGNFQARNINNPKEK